MTPHLAPHPARRTGSGRRCWSRITAVVALATLTGSLLSTPAQAEPPTGASTSGAAAPAAAATLTNLTHLNFLTDSVRVPTTAAHSTYNLTADPKVGVLWVYANGHPDGSFTRVGGGNYNPAANTYGQGAFDADDIARAAVVYLRQWQTTGSASARTHAYQEFRGLTYLQTLTGPHTGEVVLWMQPDGTLNPTPTPADSPNPSDTGPSYWLARTLWADGEGYAAFRHADPGFAAFLKTRMDLAVAALHRDVLGSYGKYQIIHGVKVPAWLIVDGADASSEAMLGLAAYTRAGGTAAARQALAELGRGVAAMSAGTTTTWPYRALLPWALSRSDWHAWGAQMPSGLAAAAAALHRPDLLAAAVGDTAGFTPQLLTSTGPDNGLLPTPIDGSQIAYGADARVQGLLAVGIATHRRGIRDLAGIAAGWFFGANPAGVPVYDRVTGVTHDGVAADGTVNANSGAESTIHGLLTMQALDAHPDLAGLARASAHIDRRDGLSVVEAETGALTGNATVQTPLSAWTGESQWSGGSYVTAGPGSTIGWTLPASPAGSRLIQPVVQLIAGATARTRFTAGRRPLGLINFGAVGGQGNAPAVGMLIPVNLPRPVPAGPLTITATTSGGAGNIDALMVLPVVATLSADGGGRAVALLTSKSGTREIRPVTLPGVGPVRVSSYDRDGRMLGTICRRGASVTAEVAAGGFTIAVRGTE